MIRQLFREAKEVLPIEKVKDGRVLWGEDNLYPQFLNGLYYDNPVHQGIIDQKIKFITAGGLSIEGADNGVLTNYNGTHTLQEVYEANIRDGEIGELWAVKFRRMPSGKWVAEAIDFEIVRRKENDLFYCLSDDWSKSRQSDDTNYREIKNIMYVTPEDQECLMINFTPPKQRVLGKNKKITANYYPSVGYAGAITSIQAGIEMDYFTYSEVVNGYKGGTLISLNNEMPDSEEKANKIIKGIKGEATDRDRQGGLTVVFAPDKEHAATVEQVSGNDLDKRYIESNKEILRKIMIAHGVISPALFGVMSDSMFGSKEEMEIAYVLFQENYAKFRQRNWTEPMTWAQKRLNGFTGKIVANTYNLSLEQNVVDETNALSEALNSLSPLVATKLMNVLTINEIRGLGKLGGVEGGDAIPTATPTDFSSDKDPILSAFEKVGRAKDSVKILHSRVYDLTSTDSDYFTQWKGGTFAELTGDQVRILQMIEGGEDYSAVNAAIGKGGLWLSKELIRLGKLGYIDGWEVTNLWQRQIIDEKQIEVLYSYELRSDAPELKGPESRPFCKTLVDMNKLYTRQEIDQISTAVDRDVWRYRGGWYHNPDTERNTPSCRHEWQQHIIVK